MSRYSNDEILNNHIEFYEFLRKERGGMKNIVQYATPTVHMPALEDRMGINTSAHIWSYGDRYYKLADQYYNNIEYWWVIAWYNGYPTEADIRTGDLIYIPLDLERLLQIVGAS